MTPTILTTGHLNRALLARQLLLERGSVPIHDAVEQIGGLQTQYPPAGYVGLWTRVAGFRREALTTALEDRSIVQATLLRATIHMVSRREFWRYAMGVRQARRAWALRLQGEAADEAAMVEAAARLRRALADGPRTVKELGGLASGFLGNHGLWVDLVRVPPSGTWERRRADRLGLAEDWVGPPDATEDEGRAHLVRAYLRAFGPAPWRDIAAWAGLTVAEAKRGGASLELVRFRDEAGRELVDVVDGPLPDPDVVAPVRFLGHWDAVLLAHARRTGVLPEEHRPRLMTMKNPSWMSGFLVDGRVAGGWTVRDGRVHVEPYRELSARERDAVEAERASLEAFYR